MPSKPTPRCPVCNGAEFVPGPKGRRAPNGMMPRCAGCKALERHRAYRLVFAAISPWCRGLQALQFSEDRAMPRDAFTIFEVSVFGGPNSLDLQAIDRPDDMYDMVIGNHVLEHVEDERAALCELDRVCKPAGVVALSVPDLLRVPRTREYGRRRDDKHGHYRIYGPDIWERWQAAVPEWSALAVTSADPVTGAPDRVNFLSRNSGALTQLEGLLRDASFAPRWILRDGQALNLPVASRA